MPEWNATADAPESEGLFVRSLTAAELDDFEHAIFEDGQNGKREAKNVRAKLVCRTVVNSDDSRVFLDSDAEWLGRENCVVIDRIYEQAARLSGRSHEEQAVIEKNSESSQSTDSQ